MLQNKHIHVCIVYKTSHSDRMENGFVYYLVLKISWLIMGLKAKENVQCTQDYEEI